MQYPPPRPVGRCLIPPRGLSFREYRRETHGPLVPCYYSTAAYPLAWEFAAWWWAY